VGGGSEKAKIAKEEIRTIRAQGVNFGKNKARKTSKKGNGTLLWETEGAKTKGGGRRRF